MKCANQIPFCRIKVHPCDHLGNESKCRMHTCEQTNGTIPTIKTVKAMYLDLHGENMSDQCVSVIREVDRFCRMMKYKPSSQITVICHDSIEAYIAKLDVKNITKIGACSRLAAFIGKRERAYYRRCGFDVRAVDTPEVKDDTAAYKSLSRKQILAVHQWFHGLLAKSDRRLRIFALMMFHYAMRNGDVERLRWSNFKQDGDEVVLEYVPHKTEHSTAGRSVKIWLTPEDQVELADFREDASDDDFVIPRRNGCGLEYIEREMNAELRNIGFTSSKGLYELRKLSIDAVFHTHGSEAASAFSGDCFKTIKKHYCDTSSVGIRGVSAGMFAKINTSAA